jgi:molecular chaperone HtpG
MAPRSREALSRPTARL